MVVGVCDERDDVGGGGCGGAGGAPGGTRAGRARRRSTSAAPLTATGAPSLSLARYTALKPPRPTTRASSNPPVSASTSRHDSRRGDSSTAEHEKERETAKPARVAAQSWAPARRADLAAAGARSTRGPLDAGAGGSAGGGRGRHKGPGITARAVRTGWEVGEAWPRRAGRTKEQLLL